MFPVAVVVGIHSTSQAFKDLTYEYEEMAFSKRVKDPTIKLLYGIASCVFRDEATNEEAKQDALDIICSKSASQLNRSMPSLLEDVRDPKAQKGTRGCLQDGLH
ncbi:hypothetical protein G6F46_012906 [Rhizopus delemar]|uniref:Uncharacterized protein n=3 Tax=Rhizopus TaxID=4842 RepID=I1CP48_RHIO9|nr:hypothetical protein RO3G_14939 [Rhizopus delemar RA 99-880]KAG1150011.1 hypothetical protein G6F36_014697 [Rhizopus arrhizus]KAG1443103.1 hypothetical protein G6F55_012767 [Rhizopus delemar]KAG1497457.1 hypothetical protein G6F54_005749 [Rhizopus delemar]KAG1502266.1 hypothetical protein G6F52_012383 [Rhizopus delemar]|eukprot:EIE90228.1 hypothetical protein RO3G_14939 [Rhizopus delemar RA 99-880]